MLEKRTFRYNCNYIPSLIFVKRLKRKTFLSVRFDSVRANLATRTHLSICANPNPNETGNA